MKTFFTYLLMALFTLAFSYKTVKYLTKVKIADTTCACDMDCEKEKEDTVEKDELKDIFFHQTFCNKNVLLSEKLYSPAERDVDFISSNYTNLVYCPPEWCC